MHRIGEFGQFLLVTATANLRRGQAVILPFLAFHRKDIVSGVTVDAGGVGFGWIILAGAGMDRRHVEVDLLNDRCDGLPVNTLFFRLDCRLGGFMHVGMARHAINGALEVLAVRQLLDVGMAVDTEPLAMGAVVKCLGIE